VVARLIATYTRRGDLVVAFDAHAAAADAAQWFGRRAALVVTTGDHVAVPTRPAGVSLVPVRRSVRLVAVVHHRVVELLHAAHGQVGLIIGRYRPDTPAHPADVELCRWLGGCAAALQPGGVLAVTVPDARFRDGYVDHASSVVAAARAAGLIYLQHIILADRPLSETPVEPGPTPALGAADRGRPPRHTRTHTDLLIFRHPGAVDA